MGYSDSTLAMLAGKELGASRELTHFLAGAQAQKEDIFRLRYDAYVADGLIGENHDGILADKYDFETASVLYGVTLQGRLVSTIRLSILSGDKRSSVSYEAFGEYLDPILDRGETIVDGTRLAVRCGDKAARRDVLLYTLALTANFASTRMVGHGSIAVRENHIPFYKRYGFDVVGEPRLYNGMLTPRTLMIIDLAKQRRCPTADMPPSPTRGRDSVVRAAA